MSLRLFSLALCAACLTASSAARAGDLDLEEDGQKPDEKADTKPDEGFGTYIPPPVATIKLRSYTLLECLALTDRNHPLLWAARARLAFVHGQLDEAKWTPWFQWSAGGAAGVIPPLLGTAFYNSTPATLLNVNFGTGWQPFFQFSIGGVVPLYTFGKMDSIVRAAEAQVRYNEWDLEKNRQAVRMDVRRAFFGLMLARDAKYIVDDVLGKLDHGIDGVRAKLRKGDTTVEDIDLLRLLVYRDEVLARAGEAKRGEAFAIAALRFLTGVQTAFDIPDEPLKRPDTPLGPVVRYLTAARLFRPDVNLARSGVVARKAQVDYTRARYFPDFGLGANAAYSVAPSSTPQTTAWIGDPFNRFGYGAAIGMRWNLDFLPNAARVAQAESQLEEARAYERLALGGVAVEVENAYGTAIEAKTREESWARAEHRAKQWISTVQDSIDVGTKDERSLIEPLRAYVNARVAHSQALMDLNVALSELARVSGWDAAAPTGS